jgi:hypothetical protein
MRLNGEITIGNIMTILSVLISATALAYGWSKDRQLRRAEYADRIRHGASMVAAKLERWPVLLGQFFDEVQPLFLDVDYLQGDDTALGDARRSLDRGLFEKRALATQRIVNEQIESAWVDLYGYDPRIHHLFLIAINRIKVLDERAFAKLRELARRSGTPPTDAANGHDALRAEVAALALAYERESSVVIDDFRQEVLKLITADDEQILKRTVSLSDPSGESTGVKQPS